MFVVNTVPLVHQQAAAIQQHTPFEVGKYEGSMGVDYWTDEHVSLLFNEDVFMCLSFGVCVCFFLDVCHMLFSLTFKLTMRIMTHFLKVLCYLTPI